MRKCMTVSGKQSKVFFDKSCPGPVTLLVRVRQRFKSRIKIVKLLYLV